MFEPQQHDLLRDVPPSWHVPLPSSLPFVRHIVAISLASISASVLAALLAFAAIAGVAIAADDSNIGSRHAVDVKKVSQ